MKNMLKAIKNFLKKTALINEDGKVNGGLVVSVSMLAIVLIQQVLAIFNVNISVHSDQLMGVINTLLTIGAMLGLVYDFNSDNK
ncbi:phage holin [Fructilactobacillus lindneri]|nr:phage holin [Fructilactobacillus lindneri]POH07513.1 hypothetical protein BGL35_00090 [Fructilactobacillus lindneri]POH08586.1 hypothetical protein BGL36_00125 [Fructilactobacillus lindneri]POH24900.1 hypothetical protein BHU33_02635 [Fructilactobacillus lindneri DSM 20690 = JCM 11027]SKA08863.1 Bacteriophage holin [Fructilactobacillus lindneri DSM 20690 = JCM 11027]